MRDVDRVAELAVLLDNAVELVDAEGFDMYLSASSMDKQELERRMKELAKIRRSLLKARHDLERLNGSRLDE